MVFPLLAVSSIIVAGGTAWGIKEFGKETGKGIGESSKYIFLIVSIAVIGYLFLKKKGAI